MAPPPLGRGRNGRRSRAHRAGDTGSSAAPRSCSGVRPTEDLEVDDLIEEAVGEARARGIVGPAVTPFVLVLPAPAKRRGAPMTVNRELIEANAGLAAEARCRSDVEDLWERVEGTTHSRSTATSSRRCASKRRRGWTRKTTIVRVHGGGEEGIGEDITYEVAPDNAAAAAGPVLALAGSSSLAGFSARLDEVGLTDDYTRWAYESAALDSHCGRRACHLPDAVDHEVPPAPVRRLDARWTSAPGSELSPHAPLQDRRAQRLDQRRTSPSSRRPHAVDVVDLKGHYRGRRGSTPTPAPELYSRVVDAFPNAYIEEDAWIDEHARPVLEPHRDRITWDAPIDSIADVESLPFPPRAEPQAVAFPPVHGSSILLCAPATRSLYGGGQCELGPGRGQIQLLASIFHPDASNDVAPAVYNAGGPRPGLPRARSSCGRGRLVSWTPRGDPVWSPGPGGARPLRLERGEQLVDGDERQRRELRAPARAELDGDFAIVRSSGASTTLTKSYSPSDAHWCRTRAPSSSTSWFTSRSRRGVRVERLHTLLREPGEHQVVGIAPASSGCGA